jgi:cobalt-precorrin 5A hydrolase
MTKIPDSPVIYSLTQTGNELAKRIIKIFPDGVHRHRPPSFTSQVQKDFICGRNGIFICATGIVIRTLAPVLKNKITDPAVVVLDENGEFVIPLLSGHEGGAGVLASIIADAINGRCVVTSATNYGNPVYTIGMGCDKSCPLEYVEELFEHARNYLIKNDEGAFNFRSLSSIDIKSNESCLVQLALSENIPFKTYNASKLRLVENQLTIKSNIVFSEVGCYGVAEAAALLAATEITGIDAEIVMPKHKNKRATVAIAKSYIQ